MSSSQTTVSWPSITSIAESVNTGSVKALSNVEKALSQIKNSSKYNAVIATLEESAIVRARDIDARVSNGESAGQLAGVPFIAKDNFLVFGAETTAASNILKGFNAPYQATVVDLLESEGAICVAKANLDAFGHGGSTENSDFGPSLNPYDSTRVPGGSSGGSAVAVVLGMVPFALGTDTGGSSRQPASFSGCVGYKPTYGLMSRSGIVAMASSTDCVGILANSVADVATVTNVMSGVDPLDSTTIDREDEYNVSSPESNLNGLKFGLIKEYLGEGIDPQVKSQILESVESIKRAGGEVTEISLPSLSLALAVYYILVPAEISSNLSRYDGQRYGFSDQTASDLESSYTLSRTNGFGAEAKRRIMIGTHVLSSGYYDAYYKKAQLVRTKIINEYNEAFKLVDFLIGPTAPTTALKLGENSADPLQMYLSDVMTVGASLAGIPAIVIPAGLANELPVGLQIMSAQKSDKKLLQTAHEIQKELNK
jgi:aspartyl-tRNA(Asn)/glutamyl-tRNA(Gln) amidotransferase subunit A